MRHQRGVGLIEVMVALLVIAVGVLGFMAMQTRALRETQEAYHYSQANMMANDLFDRMRLNLGLALQTNAYAYTFAATTAQPAEVICQPCSPEQIRSRDLRDWHGAVQRRLPAASAEVSYLTQPSAPAVIQIKLNMASVSDGNPVSFSFQTRF